MVRQIRQKLNHANRRGRPWKYKVGTVWSIVCAMNLGLFSEKSLKDVSFVSLWDVFVKKRFSKDGMPDVNTGSVLEHKLCDQMNASSRHWPFIHEARSTIAMAKSVRNRTKKKRKRVPWTLTRRQMKTRKDEAPKPRMASEGSTTGSSGYNFSFRQLHSRLPNESIREAYQSASEREARSATWKSGSQEFGQMNRADSRYPPDSYVSERKESRERASISQRPEYFRDLVRTTSNVENGWSHRVASARSSCNDEDERFSKVSRRETFESENGTIRKTARSNGKPMLLQKKKYQNLELLERKRAILNENRKLRWKTGRTKSAANRKVPRNRKRNAVDDTQPENNPKRRDWEGSQKRPCDLINAACSYKENLKSTASAIMQEIQAQIHSAEEESATGPGNTENALPESAVDSRPAEKLDDTLGRGISMEYEWVDQEDSEFNNDESSQDSKQSPAGTPKAPLAYRRKFGKKRSRKPAIDCKFVDRTETTYQSDFPECIDLETAASTPSLKINVDENRDSEDNDVGAIHSTWPRSSLAEGLDSEADGTLAFSKISDDFTADSERSYGDERTSMASACYVYRETPDVSPSTGGRKNDNRVADSSRRSSSRVSDAEDRKRLNGRDATKELITYGKRNKIDKSSVTSSDRASGTGGDKSEHKVQAKNSTDCSKSNDSDSNDNKYSLRRKTRSSIKDTKENSVGKLVWGNCSGWWPALIVDAEQVGMAPEPGKTWVYWIGESQISLLNDKTQIEPFSQKLEHRLTQKFRKNNARAHAIDETIKMLRQRYECTLTKPYYYWIRRNIAQVEELDHLNFYPYSDKIQQRLDELREKNYKTTEQHILNQRNSSPEPTKKQIMEKTKDTKAWKQMEDERLPLQEQLPGVITWAKIAGHNWWPAMIVDYRDCCLKEPGFGCQWIMWYGDYTVSQVHHLAFLRFHKGIAKLREYIENTKKHVYLVGVLQASKDYCSRLGCNTDNWTLDNVFRYFSDMNNIHVPYKNLQVSESNKVYDKYSNEIIKKINELKADTNVDSKRKDDIENSAALRRVMRGEISVEKICLKCLKTPNGEMEEHPFFEGSLCKECSNMFKPCMFVFGTDDKCFYCTICATTGTVVICDRADCPRVYCTACLKFLICPERYDDILLEDPWECFLCKSRLPADGLLQPRADWKEKVIGMFRTNSKPISDDIQIVNSNGEKRGVRVLSLFDGLSTGLVVLLKLGIVVDVYYASEIDEDALMVSSAHFGNRITYLGDVRGITKEKIKEIGPIDLLIGGSPCNDLSLVNPARLGLHDPKGTGILFFEYCRIMKQLKKINKGHHMFWLFENVASMPSEYRLEMNKHLGQEPMVIDSADYSPQHRLRLYWHNIPHDPYLPLSQKQQDVQDILTPHCNRYSLVKKIRTVTTKTFSLRQISGKAELKPIMMKGESDSLWITELEEIFGFPRHYTDVRNLSATNRQKLIGKSWSVQTLSAILRPLCFYFKCNENEKK